MDGAPYAGCARGSRKCAEAKRREAASEAMRPKGPQGAACAAEAPHKLRADRMCWAGNAAAGDVPKKAKLSEGSRADCAAIERTSEAKWPQGATPSPHHAKGCMAMDATPNAILRLRSGERTQPGGPTRRRARLRRHSPHTDIHTTTHIMQTHAYPRRSVVQCGLEGASIEN